MKKKVSKTKVGRLTRHSDLPASVGLVNEVRSEVLAEIRSSHLHLDAKITTLDGNMKTFDGKFASLDGKISTLDGKISTLDGKITSLEGKITTLDGKITILDGRVTRVEGKIEEVLAVAHRTQALMEEQRSENRIVLDGLKAFTERQDRFEERLDRLQ